MKNETALSLMQRALALYDDNGEGVTLAACHLQAAIDAATEAKSLQPGEEIDPDLLDQLDAMVLSPTDRPTGSLH